jgi:hypothetical protein
MIPTSILRRMLGFLIGLSEALSALGVGKVIDMSLKYALWVWGK